MSDGSVRCKSVKRCRVGNKVGNTEKSGTRHAASHAKIQPHYVYTCKVSTRLCGVNVDTARTMAWGDGQSLVATREMVTWEGAVGGSSYIAEGVSPVARRIDVARRRWPVSLHRRSIREDGGLTRVTRAHPHSSHWTRREKQKRLVLFWGVFGGWQQWTGTVRFYLYKENQKPGNICNHLQLLSNSEELHCVSEWVRERLHSRGLVVSVCTLHIHWSIFDCFKWMNKMTHQIFETRAPGWHASSQS